MKVVVFWLDYALCVVYFATRSCVDYVNKLRTGDIMGSVKKKRRRKIAKHKRRKQLKLQRHKTK